MLIFVRSNTSYQSIPESVLLLAVGTENYNFKNCQTKWVHLYNKFVVLIWEILSYKYVLVKFKISSISTVNSNNCRSRSMENTNKAFKYQSISMISMRSHKVPELLILDIFITTFNLFQIYCKGLAKKRSNKQSLQIKIITFHWETDYIDLRLADTLNPEHMAWPEFQTTYFMCLISHL